MRLTLFPLGIQHPLPLNSEWYQITQFFFLKKHIFFYTQHLCPFLFRKANINSLQSSRRKVEELNKPLIERLDLILSTTLHKNYSDVNSTKTFELLGLIASSILAAAELPTFESAFSKTHL